MTPDDDTQNHSKENLRSAVEGGHHSEPSKRKWSVIITGIVVVSAGLVGAGLKTGILDMSMNPRHGSRKTVGHNKVVVPNQEFSKVEVSGVEDSEATEYHFEYIPEEEFNVGAEKIGVVEKKAVDLVKDHKIAEVSLKEEKQQIVEKRVETAVIVEQKAEIKLEEKAMTKVVPAPPTTHEASFLAFFKEEQEAKAASEPKIAVAASQTVVAPVKSEVIAESKVVKRASNRSGFELYGGLRKPYAKEKLDKVATRSQKEMAAVKMEPDFGDLLALEGGKGASSKEMLVASNNNNDLLKGKLPVGQAIEEIHEHDNIFLQPALPKKRVQVAAVEQATAASSALNLEPAKVNDMGGDFKKFSINEDITKTMQPMAIDQNSHELNSMPPVSARVNPDAMISEPVLVPEPQEKGVATPAPSAPVAPVTPVSEPQVNITFPETPQTKPAVVTPVIVEPAAVIKEKEPVVEKVSSPAPEATTPMAPPIISATPAPGVPAADSTPAAISAPTIAPVAGAPVVTAEVKEKAKASADAIEFVNNLHILSIVANGKKSRIIIDGKIYRMGDRVSSNPVLVWTNINDKARRVYFTDSNGIQYMKRY